jgi:hypothetical protein
MTLRKRRFAGWIVVCVAAGPWGPTAPASAAAGAPAPPEPFLAAAGVSTGRDAVAAGEQATRSMLAKFRDRGRKPAVVIFLERMGAVGGATPAPAGNGMAVGDAIRKLAGASTYGMGGAGGVRGVTWWAKQDYEPTVLVLGMSGADVAVKAYFVPARRGEPRDESAPAMAATPQDEAAARRQGDALGRQVPALGGSGFALLLGGLAGDLCTPYAGALREALRPDVPLVGALGWPGDWVYVDGRQTAPPQAGDARGGGAAATSAPAPAAGAGASLAGPGTPGPVLLVIQGRLDVALAGTCSRNECDAEAVLAEADDVAQRAARLPGGQKPDLVIAFSHTARLRGDGLREPGQELARLRAALGKDATFFGGFAPFQAGVDNLGRVSMGPSRLMLLAVAGKAEERK